MSRLDELIQELCPDGVEIHELQEIFNTRNGYTPSKSKREFWENGTIPWFRMDDIRENGNVLSDSLQHVNACAVKGKLFPENSIIVATSATIGKHALITVPSLANQRFTYLMIKPEYKDRFLPRFLFYYCYKLDDYCLQNLNQSSFASVDMKKFVKFKIPVPPLEVQREIVRILDSFTLLTAELTAELTARKKQYEFYRNELLSFGEIIKGGSTQSSKLCEIALIYDGTHKTPNYKNSGIPFISVENINDIYGSEKFISKEDYDLYKITPQINDLFMTRIGSVGKCAIVTKNVDLAYYVSLALIRPNNKIIDTGYLKYYIESVSGTKELSKRTLHNAVPIKINKEDIGKIKITYPSLDIQKKIASTLDNFEKICSDLNIGLPAEIEARQKQYEYYRDALLTYAATGKIIDQTDRQA